MVNNGGLEGVGEHVNDWDYFVEQRNLRLGHPQRGFEKWLTINEYGANNIRKGSENSYRQNRLELAE